MARGPDESQLASTETWPAGRMLARGPLIATVCTYSNAARGPLSVSIDYKMLLMIKVVADDEYIVTVMVVIRFKFIILIMIIYFIF